MRWPRPQFRIRTFLLAVAVLGALLGAGAWARARHERGRINRGRAPIYRSLASIHAERERGARNRADLCRQELQKGDLAYQSVKFNINYFEQCEREALWHARMRQIYERALTHPYDPVTPDYPEFPALDLDPVDHPGLPPSPDRDDLLFLRQTFPELDYVAAMDYANIAELEIRGGELDDAGMVYLRGLGKLRRLDLQGAAITDAGLANLEGMHLLRELNLIDCNITDAGLAHLAKLDHLDSL